MEFGDDLALNIAHVGIQERESQPSSHKAKEKAGYQAELGQRFSCWPVLEWRIAQELADTIQPDGADAHNDEQ